MAGRRVVLLTAEGVTGRITAADLARRFSDLAVIVEQPEPRSVFLKRRLKRLGWPTVAGQIAFMVLQRLQLYRARTRIVEICRQAGLASNIPTGVEIVAVPSANSAQCIEQLVRLDPAVVLVMGTRILHRAVLQSVKAPFINYHAGITPLYRGVHGGYWALAEGDRANCGATVHVVDEGIDTGDVLAQARIEPTRLDNFSTYPYLQLVAALPMLQQAAEDAIAGRLAPAKKAGPSRLWSHPTLWAYLLKGLRRGVW
jgi:folate-dependent phosphoribosylglycinamide formyltransferase PurN